MRAYFTYIILIAAFIIQFSCSETENMIVIPIPVVPLLKSVKQDSITYLEIEYDELKRPKKKVYYPDQFYKSTQTISYLGDTVIINYEQFGSNPSVQVEMIYKVHRDTVYADLYNSEDILIRQTKVIYDQNVTCQFAKYYTTNINDGSSYAQINSFLDGDCSKQEVEVFSNGELYYKMSLRYNEQKNPLSDAFISILNPQVKNCNYYKVGQNLNGLIDQPFSFSSEFTENENGQIVKEVKSSFDGLIQVYTFEYYTS